jgi:hypothetical protein
MPNKKGTTDLKMPTNQTIQRIRDMPIYNLHVKMVSVICVPLQPIKRNKDNMITYYFYYVSFIFLQHVKLIRIESL